VVRIRYHRRWFCTHWVLCARTRAHQVRTPLDTCAHANSQVRAQITWRVRMVGYTGARARVNSLADSRIGVRGLGTGYQQQRTLPATCFILPD
jgi:hypothetical protein